MPFEIRNEAQGNLYVPTLNVKHNAPILLSKGFWKLTAPGFHTSNPSETSKGRRMTIMMHDACSLHSMFVVKSRKTRYVRKGVEVLSLKIAQRRTGPCIADGAFSVVSRLYS